MTEAAKQEKSTQGNEQTPVDPKATEANQAAADPKAAEAKQDEQEASGLWGYCVKGAKWVYNATVGEVIKDANVKEDDSLLKKGFSYTWSAAKRVPLVGWCVQKTEDTVLGAKDMANGDIVKGTARTLMGKDGADMVDTINSTKKGFWQKTWDTATSAVAGIWNSISGVLGFSHSSKPALAAVEPGLKVVKDAGSDFAYNQDKANNREELEKETGVKLTDKQFDALVQAADKDKDGRMDQEEYQAARQTVLAAIGKSVGDDKTATAAVAAPVVPNQAVASAKTADKSLAADKVAAPITPDRLIAAVAEANNVQLEVDGNKHEALAQYMNKGQNQTGGNVSAPRLATLQAGMQMG